MGKELPRRSNERETKNSSGSEQPNPGSDGQTSSDEPNIPVKDVEPWSERYAREATERDGRSRSATDRLRHHTDRLVSREHDQVAVRQIRETGRLQEQSVRSVHAHRELAAFLAESQWSWADAEALRNLSQRLESALTAIGDVVADDRFWDRIKSAVAPGFRLTREDTTRLEGITWGALPELLEVQGYSDPPPPSADDLVAQAVDALRAALVASVDGVAATDRVDQARQRLGQLVERAREQIPFVQNSKPQPAFRRLLARVGAALTPIIVAAAPAFATESVAELAANRGASAPAVEAIRQIVGHAAQRLVAAVITFGNRERSPEPSDAFPDIDPNRNWADVYMIAHLDSLERGEQAHRKIQAAYNMPPPADAQQRQDAWSSYRQSIEAAGRQLTRLQQHLSADRNMSPEVEWQTEVVREGLDEVREVVTQPAPPIPLWTGAREETDLLQSMDLQRLIQDAAELRHLLAPLPPQDSQG